MTLIKKAALLIDGAYFEEGCDKIIKKAKNPTIWNNERIDLLLKKLSCICGVEFVSRKFVTAENEESRLSKLSFHYCLKYNQVAVDIRDFKKKKETCPHCKKQYERSVQAEVAVAIAVNICEEVFYKSKNPVDTIVLLTGERDFKDAIRSAIEKKAVEVILVGFKNSIHEELKAISGVVVVPSLDSIICDILEINSHSKAISNLMRPDWDVFGLIGSLESKKKAKNEVHKRAWMDITKMKKKKVKPHTEWLVNLL
jgi:uncharacterized LabA/DUF88 family protein